MAEQNQLTLQSRITAYMVVISVLLIAVFTFMQVNNQLKTLTQHNIFKSKLGATLAKNALENALLKTPQSQLQPDALNKTLDNLKKLGIIEDIDIAAQDGKIIASTNKYSLNLSLPPKEQQAVKMLFKSAGQTKSEIDKRQSIALQYLPLIQTIPPLEDETQPAQSVSYAAKISYSIGNLNEALKEVYVPCVFIAAIIIVANIILSIALSKVVVGPLKILNSATKEIAAGNLNLRVELPTGDEIEEVANTFNDMTVALIRMKERAENANPLTKLPGNNVIHEEIEKRIADKRKFVVVYSDLDNFKAFNDKYGIGAGDQAIKMTAAVMQESLKSGSPDDFLGHEGGDDFLLLTTPDKAKAVTNYITSEFDKRIRALYDKEDLGRGYIVAKSREGDIKQFPIMTVSLAGVSNITQDLTSYGQITNICANVKKIAKKTSGSVFVLDRRTGETPDSTEH